jgi:hypothetical protein
MANTSPTKRVASKALEGRTIQLLRCNDPHTSLRPGARGTVTFVDDMGTVHVDWEDGQKLGLCWDDGDRWTVAVASKHSEFAAKR